MFDMSIIMLQEKSETLGVLRKQSDELHKAGRYEEALAVNRKIMELDDTDLHALNNVGSCLAESGRVGEAANHYMQALMGSKSVDNRDVIGLMLSNFGSCLCRMGYVRQAYEAIKKAQEYIPSSSSMLVNLCACEQRMGKIGEAIMHGEEALKLGEGNAQAWHNLSVAYRDAGQLEDSLRCINKALEIEPNQHESLSGKLLTMCYLGGYDPDKERSQINTVFEKLVGPKNKLVAYEHEKLRIGYVSADMRRHSVAYFLYPLFAHHDRKQFEIYAYYRWQGHDEITRKFVEKADKWRDCGLMTSDELSAQIMSDEIDILVDLSGHTEGNALPVFKKRSAPIQVSYLGYPLATCLDEIDYRISDEDVGEIPGEKTILLETTQWAYDPMLGGEPVRDKYPSENKTYGCFCNLPKINMGVLKVWAEILRREPKSRLILKSKGLDDPYVASRLRASMLGVGLDTSRVELHGYNLKHSEHLDLYRHVDVALDTWPYNGTTTTCEAIAMGVPVVTMVTPNATGKTGLSLSKVSNGMVLVARDAEEYVQLAISGQFGVTWDYSMIGRPLTLGERLTRCLEANLSVIAKREKEKKGS